MCVFDLACFFIDDLSNLVWETCSPSRGYLRVLLFYFFPILALICLPKPNCDLWWILIWCFNFVLLYFVILPLNVVYHCTRRAVFLLIISLHHMYMGQCCARYDYPNLCEFKKRHKKNPTQLSYPDPVRMCLYPWERSCDLLSGFFAGIFWMGQWLCYCLDFPFAYVSVLSSNLLLSSSIPSQTIRFLKHSVDTFFAKVLFWTKPSVKHRFKQGCFLLEPWLECKGELSALVSRTTSASSDTFIHF